MECPHEWSVMQSSCLAIAAEQYEGSVSHSGLPWDCASSRTLRTAADARTARDWYLLPGHGIRFAVNNAQWPMLWPTKYPMTTSLKIGGKNGAYVLLPVVPPGERAGPKFLAPVEDS